MRILKLAKKLKDTDKVVSEIIGDPKIWMECLKIENTRTLHRMVDQLVRDEVHRVRTELLRKTHPAVTSIEDAKKRRRGRDRVHARLQESALDWPIWGKKPIRDCTRDEIQHSIHMRKKQMEEGKDSIRLEKAAVQLMVGAAKDALFGDVVSERAFNAARRDLVQSVAARR